MQSREAPDVLTSPKEIAAINTAYIQMMQVLFRIFFAAAAKKTKNRSDTLSVLKLQRYC